MAQFIQPHAAMVAICKALNLDPGEVRSIHISVMPDELVTASVELFLSDEKVDAIANVLKDCDVKISKARWKFN